VTQLSPNTSIYSKALSRLRDVNRNYSLGNLKTPEDYIAAINDIAHQLLSEGEKPHLFYDFIEHGEPPLSREYNRFWESMSSDVTIAYDQINYLKAHVINGYNLSTAEIKKARNENARVKGKLKTLQLYSTSVDNGIRIFGDFFTNFDFIDLEKTPNSERAELANYGLITLGKTNEVENLLNNAVVTVDDESNGFLGRNQEISNPESAPIDPVTNTAYYTFTAENASYNDMNAILDDNPDTWLEYEHNWVDNATRESVGNIDFRYRDDRDNAEEPYLDWASGPEDGVLKLVLNFDLQSVKKASRIVFIPHKVSPYGLHPIRIKNVTVSPNGADWTRVSNKTVWVGTDINISGISANEEIVIGSAVWEFDEQTIRYAKMEIEQIWPIQSNIGHMYFQDQSAVTLERDENGESIYLYTASDRIEGPVPPVSDIGKYYDPTYASSKNLIQFREYFEGQRWVIGIKDISIESVRYNETSTIISKPFRIDGEVDRITIDADYDIPPSFASDQKWVKFYVSTNNGLDWYQISDIRDSSLDIPEIIAFNDPLPAEFREQGVAYYNTGDRVDSLLVRIDLSRPSDASHSTPVVRNYQLKVLKR